jgi:hypothetical protein
MPGDDVAALRSVTVCSLLEGRDEISVESGARMLIEYECRRDGVRLTMSVIVYDTSGSVVFSSGNYPSATNGVDTIGTQPHLRGMYRSEMQIPQYFLNDKTYVCTVSIMDDSHVHRAWAENIVSFSVHDEGQMRGEFNGEWWGAVRPRLTWHTIQVSEAVAE